MERGNYACCWRVVFYAAAKLYQNYTCSTGKLMSLYIVYLPNIPTSLPSIHVFPLRPSCGVEDVDACMIELGEMPVKLACTCRRRPNSSPSSCLAPLLSALSLF